MQGMVLVSTVLSASVLARSLNFPLRLLQELLKAYYRCHRRAPSENVVMYRDGVSGESRFTSRRRFRFADSCRTDSEWSAVLSRGELRSF